MVRTMKRNIALVLAFVGFGAMVGCKAKAPQPVVETTAAPAPAAPEPVASATEAPPEAAPAPVASADTTKAAAAFKAGQKVTVIWKGSPYKATVLAVVAPDKFKIHYDGYGSNWDEVVGPSRIKRRA